MKVRSDFVTNSSSSSFIIAKRYLDEDQIEAIRKNRKLGMRLGLEHADEEWQIEENAYYITGFTWMDNYDINKLFNIIDIEAPILWGEWRFGLDDYCIGLYEKQDKNEPKTWRDLLNEI